MVVAVVFVGPMQSPVDEVINVVAMWNGFVSAALAMCMRGIARGGTGVARWVRFINRDYVLVDMVLVMVVQMTVVDVVDVIGVADGYVSATGSVLMRMVALMDVVGHEPTLEQLAALCKRPTLATWWLARDHVSAGCCWSRGPRPHRRPARSGGMASPPGLEGEGARPLPTY